MEKNPSSEADSRSDNQKFIPVDQAGRYITVFTKARHLTSS
jgi:hypothetical protein